MSTNQRRSFLKQASVLGAAGLTTPWALNLASMGVASAQSSGATDYKALVCIFLGGGNDAHNTVIPTDEASWYYYSVARDANAAIVANGGTPIPGALSIALKRSELLPITIKDTGGFNADRNFKSFALHPQLKRIRDMYVDGKAAVIANVGPLIMPTNKIDLFSLSFPVPANLMSHNDQQSMWQSFAAEGAVAGWGGLMMDSLMSRNTVSTFSCIGINSGPVWLSGKQVMPYQLSTSGLTRMAGEGSTYGSAAVYQAVRKIAATPTSSDVLAQDYTKIVQRALSVESTLLSSLPAAAQAPWGTPGAATSASDPLLKYTDPNTGLSTLNPLAQQLQLVARMISARGAAGIGAKRQVFMVTLNGFDTHDSLLVSHGELMAKLDHGVAYFYDTLAKMPGGQDMRSNVTSFTASDFGRALNNNGDGTDHGWGGHHFVFGSSVKGGDMYGRYPDFSPFDQGTYFSANLLTNGVLLPSQSVDQVVYTLGKWMDVPESDLTGAGGTVGIAPNIGNFDVSTRNLGFMA
ncbi:DUF1501 domain-containing protein [Aquabacterium sp.]|uniref:DUF1501 domain-containing protein n=1 Tax=Aquabacterium sp. TaxID=1872578 RepID=UPI001991F723|nr:DUF1501 domain-containing protein [Aquabacterium sp.]MBC7699908.1 DUF1501 domain-containing protein [Aquabacterium sp.]